MDNWRKKPSSCAHCRALAEIAAHRRLLDDAPTPPVRSEPRRSIPPLDRRTRRSPWALTMGVATTGKIAAADHHLGTIGFPASICAWWAGFCDSCRFWLPHRRPGSGQVAADIGFGVAHHGEDGAVAIDDVAVGVGHHDVVRGDVEGNLDAQVFVGDAAFLLQRSRSCFCISSRRPTR